MKSGVISNIANLQSCNVAKFKYLEFANLKSIINFQSSIITFSTVEISSAKSDKQLTQTP
jgi:hypothetical protein